MKVLIVADGWLCPITPGGTMTAACNQCRILKSFLVRIHARYGANYGETFVDRHLLCAGCQTKRRVIAGLQPREFRYANSRLTYIAIRILFVR